LNLLPTEVKPALHLLAEAEFVVLDTRGRTIVTVIPNVPYFDDLYSKLGKVALETNLTEAEQLTLKLASRLSRGPVPREHAYAEGAEKKLTDKVVGIGTTGGFLIQKRARGKNILLSPAYFTESEDAYADLVAASGAGRVAKNLTLLRQYQGWPLSKLEESHALGGQPLDDNDLAVIKTLAGDGFLPPPAITTTHSGTNHFIFGPRPGIGRLPLHKKNIYERAMALVAAVRQGQLLPEQYAIKYPVALLRALKERGYIRASTEAWEQYRQVAGMRVARLVRTSGNWARLELAAEAEENVEALDMAIELVQGTDLQPRSNEQATIALQQGHRYMESLIARKHLVQAKIVPLSQEDQEEIDTMMLRGQM
jgi:hypothetical protein